MTFTVIGSSGMIGTAICDAVRSQGEVVAAISRTSPIPDSSLGNVIFAAGVTGNFLERRADGLDAHVRLVDEVLRCHDFTSFTYLSSTRLYKRAESTEEDAPIPVRSDLADDYYTLTKLMGEALCHGVTDRPSRVIRLSNVVGHRLVPGNFLHSIVSHARKTGHARFTAALSSSKDYVCLDDAVEAIFMISEHSRERAYNVASGRNIEHGEIASLIRSELGAAIEVSPDAESEIPRRISIGRVSAEFGFCPSPVLPMIKKIMQTDAE